MLRNQLIRNCGRHIRSTLASTSSSIKSFNISKNGIVVHPTLSTKLITTAIVGGCSLMYFHTTQQSYEAQASSKFYDLSATSGQTGETISMSEMRGKVCLIVNVASNCGFTPQYSK